MIKDFTNFLTRFMTALVFTSLLISCQKTSQNQLSSPQPTKYQSEYNSDSRF